MSLHHSASYKGSCAIVYAWLAIFTVSRLVACKATALVTFFPIVIEQQLIPQGIRFFVWRIVASAQIVQALALAFARRGWCWLALPCLMGCIIQVAGGVVNRLIAKNINSSQYQRLLLPAYAYILIASHCCKVWDDRTLLQGLMPDTVVCALSASHCCKVWDASPSVWLPVVIDTPFRHCCVHGSA